MLPYASILEKPKYEVRDGKRIQLATGEIVEAACAALRICARIKAGK
jgi:phage gp45-like